MHTNHRSNRRTLHEISEGENGHGRRLHRRGQLSRGSRDLRHHPEDGQAGRRAGPGRREAADTSPSGPQHRRRGRGRRRPRRADEGTHLGQAPAARGPGGGLWRLGAQLPPAGGGRQGRVAPGASPRPAPRGVGPGRDPHHRLGIGGPSARVLRGGAVEPVPLRALRRRREGADDLPLARRVLRGARRRPEDGPRRSHGLSQRRRGHERGGAHPRLRPLRHPLRLPARLLRGGRPRVQGDGRAPGGLCQAGPGGARRAGRGRPGRGQRRRGGLVQRGERAGAHRDVRGARLPPRSPNASCCGRCRACGPQIGKVTTRKVDKLSCIRFGSARYSVPISLIGRTVEVHVAGDRVRVVHLGSTMAEHALVAPGETSVTDDHYGGPRPAPRRAPRPRSDVERAVLVLRPGGRGLHQGGGRLGGDHLGHRAAASCCTSKRPTGAAPSSPPWNAPSPSGAGGWATSARSSRRAPVWRVRRGRARRSSCRCRSCPPAPCRPTRPRRSDEHRAAGARGRSHRRA